MNKELLFFTWLSFGLWNIYGKDPGFKYRIQGTYLATEVMDGGESVSICSALNLRFSRAASIDNSMFPWLLKDILHNFNNIYNNKTESTVMK